MAEKHLVLCGESTKAPAKGWSDAPTLVLKFGPNKSDVHLKIEHLSRRLCSNLLPQAVDLVEIAAYVYAADQAIGRGGTKTFEYGCKWRRHVRFEIPVRKPDFWERPDVLDELCRTLGFLSDDDYEFS